MWGKRSRLFVTVLLTELVNTAGGIEQYVLTRVERVRLRANFDFYQWVRLTFKLHRVFGLNS